MTLHVIAGSRSEPVNNPGDDCIRKIAAISLEARQLLEVSGTDYGINSVRLELRRRLMGALEPYDTDSSKALMLARACRWILHGEREEEDMQDWPPDGDSVMLRLACLYQLASEAGRAGLLPDIADTVPALSVARRAMQSARDAYSDGIDPGYLGRKMVRMDPDVELLLPYGHPTRQALYRAEA